MNPDQQAKKAKSYSAVRVKITLARSLGRLEGIEAAARLVETADNTMMKQTKLPDYIRTLKTKEVTL